MIPIREELQKAAREAAKQDKELLELLEALEGVKGWQRYRDHLNALAQERASSLLMSLPGMDAVLGQEFEKGTIKGLLLAATLPSIMIQVAREERPAGKEDET